MSLAVVQQILFAFFPVAMAWAAASDLITMTISNKLSLALVAGFVALAPLSGMDLETFGLHVAVAAIVLAATFGFFAAGWIGGGDAKFSAAVALWLGWSHALDFLALSAVFGGVLTLIILTYRRALLPAFALRQHWLARLYDKNAGVPYGVALAAAALVVYPDTVWMRLAIG